jgi:ribosomal protein S12 methylthiotransferase accessory factor
LISDVVGVVPYVRQSGPDALRAFAAGANIAAHDDLVLLKSRLRSASGGKGISISAARTGALAEALERHSLRATGGEPHLRCRLQNLPGPAVLPNEIQLFSEAQLHRTEQLAALGIEEPVVGKGFHRVPRMFDSDVEHDWSPIADWRTGETLWLPASMVWFGWPGLPHGYPTGSSNGAAAGNTMAEALLQGVLELVERDSVALWWHPRCHRPAFDLDAWDDPRIDAALAAQRSLGSDVWVLDVTTDLGIPAAVAVASGWTSHTSSPLLGFGAHLDPALAVVRALTELAQMQAPVIASQGQILQVESGTPEASWFDQVTVDSEPWLAPHGVAPIPVTPTYADVDEAVAEAVARLADHGLRVMWADCTRPDIGLPVVRTWAPGLRHFWNRYAPGRLYDVPPALGWCPPGYTEDDLNPRPMIL